MSEGFCAEFKNKMKSFRFFRFWPEALTHKTISEPTTTWNIFPDILKCAKPLEKN